MRFLREHVFQGHIQVLSAPHIHPLRTDGEHTYMYGRSPDWFWTESSSVLSTKTQKSYGASTNSRNYSNSSFHLSSRRPSSGAHHIAPQQECIALSLLVSGAIYVYITYEAHIASSLLSS